MACFISQSFATSLETPASLANIISSQLAIPSKSLKDYNKPLKVFFPFYYSSQETTGSQSQSQSHFSDVDHLTLLLLNTWLVEAGNLWFSQIKLLIVHLFVQLHSIICVHQILFCLLLISVISCNPIDELCSSFLILPSHGPLGTSPHGDRSCLFFPSWTLLRHSQWLRRLLIT